MRKILFLAANPQPSTRLRLDQEVRDISEGLSRARHRDDFEFVAKWAVSRRDLRRAVQEEEPHIVHFSGHGDGDAGLYFEDNDAAPGLITGSALAELFKLSSQKEKIECVVLNRCYSQVQAETIANCVPYVIGMRQSVSDQAAIEFSVGFYDALGNRDTFDLAFSAGKVAMALSGTGDENMPILIKTDDAVLPDESTLDENQIIESTQPTKGNEPLQLFPETNSDVTSAGTEPSINHPEWLVFGAGRIGRGLISVIASELKFKITQIVAGKNTSSSAARLLDAQEMYRINVFDYIRSNDYRVCEVRDFRFLTKYQSSEFARKISDENTKIVSTSVGLVNLEEIAEIVAEGVYERINKGIAEKLLILVFENGKAYYDDRERLPVEIFVSRLVDILEEDGISGEVVSQYIETPQAVLDCYIPNIPLPFRGWKREKGVLWIEDLPKAREYLSAVQSVNLHFENIDSIRSIHFLKHFGFGSLNAFYAIIGLILNVNHLDEVFRDELSLNESLTEVRESICKVLEHRIDGCLDLRNYSYENISSYCRYSHERMSHDDGFPWFESTRDELDRIYSKIIGPDYIADNRIFGPLIELLNQGDEEILFTSHRALIHTISIYVAIIVRIHASGENLESVSKSRSRLYKCLNRRVSIAKINIERFVAKLLDIDIFRQEVDPLEERLVNVISDDVRYLDGVQDRDEASRWGASGVKEFLERPIKRQEISIFSSPQFKPIKVVIFDLDEGIVNSESELYSITREIIERHRRSNHLHMSIEEYANWVGTSEASFFNNAIKSPFDFPQNYSADDLSRLDSGSSSIYYRPGLHIILSRLSQMENIKIAIYSNASKPRMIATLNYVSCRQFFTDNTIISGTDPGMEEKPSPKMIEHLLSQFSATAQQCLVVESTDTGIASARNAGCFCLKIANDFSHDKEQRGVEVFSNFFQLRDWFSDFFHSNPYFRDTIDANNLW
jgi:beta-phosphoglucomutase-like phosphatase (HAD superfamily)